MVGVVIGAWGGGGSGTHYATTTTGLRAGRFEGGWESGIGFAVGRRVVHVVFLVGGGFFVTAWEEGVGVLLLGGRRTGWWRDGVLVGEGVFGYAVFAADRSGVVAGGNWWWWLSGLRE